MSLIRSTRIIHRHFPNHQRVFHSDLSQGHAALDRGAPGHQYPQDESAKYVKSGLDAGNRGGRGKHASREGAAGNKEGVGFQGQVWGAAGDRQNPGGGEGDRQEARSPNIVGAVKQVLGFEPRPDEVKQNSGGGTGVTGTGTSRKDFHTSSGLDAGTKELPQDPRPPSGSQKIERPESLSERVYKREANKAEEAVETSYEPNRPSGEQEKLRYGGKQNRSKESEEARASPVRTKGQIKVRRGEGGRMGDSDGDARKRSTTFHRKSITFHSRLHKLGNHCRRSERGSRCQQYLGKLRWNIIRQVRDWPLRAMMGWEKE